MKTREGEGGKSAASRFAKLGHGTGKPEIVLCREDGRVCCFLSVDNYHLNPCGSPGVDWKYSSPKSIMVWAESGRGQSAGHIIENSQFLAKMTGYKMRDELTACDIGKNRRR